jgi:hypothetical protein
VAELADQGELEGWYTLTKRSKSSKVKGKIQLRISFIDYSSKDLYIEVGDASNVLDAKGDTDPEVFTLIRVGEYEMQTSTVRSSNPQWNEMIQLYVYLLMFWTCTPSIHTQTVTATQPLRALCQRNYRVAQR